MRYLRYPQLGSAFKELIRTGINAPVTTAVEEMFLVKNNAVVSICSLSSKALRLNDQVPEENMICVYKSGLILNPGELISWTNQRRRLTSTRHKNVLLRIAHGDVFSNERLHRFGLKDSPKCSNCNEPFESPLHRVVECLNARRTWNIMDAARDRLGLRQLTDHSIENLLGAKDKLNKIELAIQAELLQKIISTSEPYSPERIVANSIKVIQYSERLEPELYEKFRVEIERNI